MAYTPDPSFVSLGGLFLSPMCPFKDTSNLLKDPDDKDESAL